jgi:hypothetical protein
MLGFALRARYAGLNPTYESQKLGSDVYAVGMIGIQALTGKTPDTLPEDSNTGEVVWRDRAQVSKNLAKILDKMVRGYFTISHPKTVMFILRIEGSRNP